MFATSKSQVRKVDPDHKEWIPHSYQERAVDFLVGHQSAALFLDPGLGKTSITLAAFDTLRGEGIAKKMLVIAPLRVCQLVWEQEGQEWTQFRHLKFALLHGSKKKAALEEEADIYLINPEGIAWLTKQFFVKMNGKNQKWPFDTVTIDELTKFKNAQSVRHKTLMPFMPKVSRRWGLTGTPIPNGYLDLFGQMKVLDGGASLGQWFTRFRDKFFEADYSGFRYLLRRGGAKAIEAAVKPYVLRMSAEDYLSLPPFIDDIISVVLPPAARKTYETMKKEMIAELEGTVVEAGNSAAVYSKLKQMANGAVYAGDGVFEPKKVVHIHDAKIDALKELVEELAGTPLLVGYEFRHDLARLQKEFPDAPYIGSGVTADQAKQIEKDWNANNTPILFAHPASAGHGLNFQKGNAMHVAWFSATWDYELYDQFNKRVFRQGNKATTVFNHVFIVEDTIDNKTRDAILQKGFTQKDFCSALNAEIYHTGKTATPPKGIIEDDEMVKRLSRRSAAPVEAVEEEEIETAEVVPARTSTRRSSREKLRGEAAEEVETEEEEAEAPRTSARRNFSKAVQNELEEEKPETTEEEEFPAPTRANTRKAPVKAPDEEVEEDDELTQAAMSTLGAVAAGDDVFHGPQQAILDRIEELTPKAKPEDLGTLIAVLQVLKMNLGH